MCFWMEMQETTENQHKTWLYLNSMCADKLGKEGEKRDHGDQFI